ncbi:MAG TPA: septal ring lytic transglycosylase RlpA family protein [Acidobacteriaceae bacterium]
MTESLPILITQRRRISTYAGLFVALAIGISGANVGRSASVASKAVHPELKRHWYQIGRASWYGGSFNGRATASGENYNMTDLTCAHRSLPLGTLVRVTNLGNHKSVVVRVNDRGPMLASRVIDLSYAAAHFLGFSGTTQVRLDVLGDNGTVAELHYPASDQGSGSTPADSTR